jgi:hypothetical protein
MLPALPSPAFRPPSNGSWRPPVLLCRERDPLDCHRLHLICRYLAPGRASIKHILPNAEIEPQVATERRLLERSGASALPLFKNDERLEQAYESWW